MFHSSKWIRTSAKEIHAPGAGFTKGFIRQTQTPGLSQLRGFDPAPRKTHSFQNWRTDALQRDFYGPGLSQPWEDLQRCSVWWLSQLHWILVAESRENEKTSTGTAASTGTPNPGNLSWTLDSSSCTGMLGGDQGEDVTVLWHRASQCSVQGNGASRWPGFQWNDLQVRPEFQDVRIIPTDPSSDKWVLTEIKKKKK